jgi:prepilin-type processing-associated H-X9-DG protein
VIQTDLPTAVKTLTRDMIHSCWPDIWGPQSLPGGIQYTVGSGWILPDRYADWAQGTNHMDKKDPDGANIGFLDGHQEWRHFENMCQPYQKQGLYLWW